MHYQIEYYNKVFKDWLAFDQWFYKTKEQAKKQIEFYKKEYSNFETRIVEIKILEKKPNTKKTKIAIDKV